MADILNTDRYKILEEVGKGGMASVYKGWDKELEREVAIKLLHPHLAEQKESKSRFHREAKAVAKLKHPNVIEIYDYSGQNSSQAYIVAEFIYGSTLRKFYEEHMDMPNEIVLSIVMEICAGLGHAHKNGIIHRDIKPENILIRQDGIIKLTDFGIAQLVGTTHMTVTGEILGSPAYMSPEHIECKNIDFRSDIFSVGILLYWLLTGRLPFEGLNPHAVIKKIMDGIYIDPLRISPQIGESSARIIRKCLQINPTKRYQTIESLNQDINYALKEVDFNNHAEEWIKYYHNPEDYAKKHKGKIVKILWDKGKEAQKDHNTQKALDYFNRLISIDEQNQKVLEQIKGIELKDKIKKIMFYLAAIIPILLLITMISYGIYTKIQKYQQNNNIKKIAKNITDKKPKNIIKPLKQIEQSQKVPNNDISKINKHLKVAKNNIIKINNKIVHANNLINNSNNTEEKFRMVKIIPNPPRAKIFIDDNYIGEFGGATPQDRMLSTQGIKILVGKHKLKLEPIPLPNNRFLNETLFIEQIIPEGNDVFWIRRQLPWKPSSVLILTSTRDVPVEVIVEGRERGFANKIFKVNVYDYEERFDITISAPGYQIIQLKQITLKAGGDFIERVTLKRE